jgi:hypothetical protein
MFVKYVAGLVMAGALVGTRVEISASKEGGKKEAENDTPSLNERVMDA